MTTAVGDPDDEAREISDAFIRKLFGSGSIDPHDGSVTVNISSLHPGEPALQGEIARWIVGALGGEQTRQKRSATQDLYRHVCRTRVGDGATLKTKRFALGLLRALMRRDVKP